MSQCSTRHLLCVSLALCLAISTMACSKSSGSSGGGGKRGDNTPGNTDPGGGGGGGDQPPTNTGTLQIAGMSGIGRGNAVATGGNVVQDVPVGVSRDGSVQPLTLAIGQNLALNTDYSTYPKVGCVLNLGIYGTLIQANQRSAIGGAFASGNTNLAVVSANGTLTPLVPSTPRLVDIDLADCEKDIQFTSDGLLFARQDDGMVIWRFSLADFTGEVVAEAPINTEITALFATTGGHLVYNGANRADGTQPYSRWLSPVGTETDLKYPNVYALNPRVFGDSGFTYANGQGGMMVTPGSSGITRFFVEPFYYEYIPRWSQASRVTIDNWIVTNLLALKANDSKMASNPLWRSQYRFQGLIDADNQLYFDGSNIVKVTYDATNGLQVKHHRNIIHNALNTWKIISVFGPAQGFTDKWAGVVWEQGFKAGTSFAEENNSELYPKQYWVEIDPTTGVIDDSKVYKLYAPNFPGPTAHFGTWNIPEFTAYKLASTSASGGYRIMGLGGLWGAGLFELSFNEGTKTATLGTNIEYAASYEHPYALINGHKLYYTASWYNSDTRDGFMTRIYSFDADANILTDKDQAIAPSGDFTTSVRECNAQKYLGLIQQPGQSGPSLLFCGADSKISLVTFSDFTFATQTNMIQLPVVFTGRNDESDFYTGVVNNSYWMQVYPLSADNIVLGLGKRRVAKVLNASNGLVVSTVDFKDLNTENRLEFSRVFGPNNEANTLAKWGTSTLLASGNTDAGYRSYLVDLPNRTYTQLSDLNDKYVGAAIRINDTEFMVSVYDPNTYSGLETWILNESGTVKTKTASEIAVETIAPL